jgi:hypothetical protein
VKAQVDVSARRKICMATTMATKESLKPADFYYRQNGDGTVDAICLRCFLTAATAATLEELTKREKAHGDFCVWRKPSVHVSSA